MEPRKSSHIQMQLQYSTPYRRSKSKTGPITHPPMCSWGQSGKPRKNFCENVLKILSLSFMSIGTRTMTEEEKEQRIQPTRKFMKNSKTNIKTKIKNLKLYFKL
jgi:hypothetical protein